MIITPEQIKQVENIKKQLWMLYAGHPDNPTKYLSNDTFDKVKIMLEGETHPDKIVPFVEFLEWFNNTIAEFLVDTWKIKINFPKEL